MSAIEVRPVSTPEERRTFLTFPWRIYRHDPLWVPPVLANRLANTDPTRGVFFRRGGEAQFFIAWRGDEPVGTICAADDKDMNAARSLKDCVFGFFECIQNAEVSAALFDMAAAWARQRGLGTLYGPFNLDYEDSYGVHISGRDRPPVVLCGHSPPYYQSLVEGYGFPPARGDGLAFEVRLDVPNPTVERLHRLAERVRQRRAFTIRSANLADWDAEIERVYRLINIALAHLPDFLPWQRESLQESLSAFKPFIDPDLVLFAESQGQVVGWFPGIPNLNEALIHANGLRYPWDYLRLAWHSRRKPACLAVKSVLVLPEYWDTGVSILMFDEMAQRALQRGYTWVDLSITAEDNPDTPILAAHTGAREYKRYRVYRLPL